MRGRAGRHRLPPDPDDGYGVSDALVDVRDTAVAFVVCMLLVSAAPVALGWRSTVVVSGSMAPRVRAGDVVSAAPVRDIGRASIKPGTVVLVKDPASPGELLLHRLVRYDKQGDLVLQGDANANQDSTPVPQGNVVGVARMKVPYAGMPFLWVQRGQFLPAVAAGILLLALIAWQPRPRKLATVLHPPEAWSGPQPHPK